MPFGLTTPLTPHSIVKVTPSKPIFLIPMPQLNDPNFARTVVLILHHDATGAMGLVVNNPTELNLGSFARNQNIPCHASLETVPVFRGGPVEQQRGWVLHSSDGVPEKQEIVPGLYLSGTPESLRILLEQGAQPIRLLLGYAGWAPGQLEGEMAQGAWLTAGVDPRHVLQTKPSEAWGAVLKDMGVDPAALALGQGIH